MNTEQMRGEAVTAALQQVRDIENSRGIDRSSLDEIRGVMIVLAGRKELFDASAFAPPSGDSPAALYLLNEDEDHRFALYIVSGDNRTKSPPHNHKTWAVIAGMAGEEENIIYERVDDAAVEGVGQVEEKYRTVLADGDAIAFMPEDIHSIRVVSEEPTRHFHLYGKAFAQQTGRIAFNRKDGTCFPMPDNAPMVDTSHQIERQPA